MKIVSWNVNGIRAIQKKGFKKIVQEMDPTFLCLQETKAQNDQVAEALAEIEGYHLIANSADRKGYSGTAILSKVKPISTFVDIGIEEHDREGRVTAMEFEQFYLINVYVPNSGNELVRLGYRKEWDADFLSFLKKLEQKKPIIVCGDFNVAHQPIDLARPKQNYDKSAGYTQVEIDGMDHYIAAGLVDTFRFLHPDDIQYSWWSYRFDARNKDIGWRIDYVLVSEILKKSVSEAFILKDFLGSDHCPVGIILD